MRNMECKVNSIKKGMSIVKLLGSMVDDKVRNDKKVEGNFKPTLEQCTHIEYTRICLELCLQY